MYALNRPGRYSDEIRQQALAMVFPQIATGNIADLIKAFANKPSAEVEEFVTECIACLPTEWLIVECVLYHIKKDSRLTPR